MSVAAAQYLPLYDAGVAFGEVESVLGTFAGSRSPSVTFTTPPVTNDIIALFCASTTTATITIPSGWVNALGGTTDVESAVPHEMAVVYHIVTSGEAGAATTTFTATNLYDNAETGDVAGAVVRGVDTADPLAGTPGTGFGGASPHVLPATTPDADGGLVMSGIAKNVTGNYLTAPAGWTMQVSGGTNQAVALLTYDTATTNGVAVGPTNITP